MSSIIELNIFAIATAWMGIGYGLWSKRQAGSVLLNLGRSRRHNMFLYLAGLMMLLSIVDLWDLVQASTELREVSSFLLWLSVGIYFLFLGLSGLEIREAGIFCDGQLLKWERIESYEWEEKALTVRVKRRWYSRPTVSCAVPPLHRHTVNSLFAQHVSGATVEPGNGTR